MASTLIHRLRVIAARMRRVCRPSGLSVWPREPLSRRFGLDRGTAIDRVVIEAFLDRHRDDIHGRVLEVADSAYTRRFGGARVTQADVLHAQPGNPQATIIGDLASGQGIPVAAFDCIVLTQVLQFIPDPSLALRTCARALRPGGALLATVPGISQISRYDAERWGDFWRFTGQGLGHHARLAFEDGSVEIATHGNAWLCSAFLFGLAREEVPAEAFAHDDPDYPLIVTVRAQRP